MRLTKVVLAAVLVLLSAAWAQTRVRGDGPPAAGRGDRHAAAPDKANVAGSVNAFHPPIPTPTSCPRVDVSCPDVLKPGQPITLVANISGGDLEVTPTFKWKVSTGTIISGQGTSAITVAISDAAGQSYTAFVEVGGYDPACPMSVSCSLMPGFPVTARQVDEYGGITVRDEKARLDNFALELQNDPTAQGYLICYGGRRDARHAARRRCDRARNFLVAGRGVEPPRLVALDGGYRESPTVEAWVVPPGAAPPKPTPTAFPRGGRRR